MAPLRILSVNLLVDRADADDLRRVISDTDPDVIALQELGERSAAVVAEFLPHGHLDPFGDFFGMGIATRYPADVDRLELEGRSGWVAHLEPGRWPHITRPLDVVNVHLVNPVDRPWSVSRGSRRRQIAQIRAYLDGRDAASVIIGDMNASPVWPAYKLLTALGTDAAAATGTALRTWAPATRGPRLLRIDHAFVAGAQSIRTEVVPVKGSDHWALIVDLDV